MAELEEPGEAISARWSDYVYGSDTEQSKTLWSALQSDGKRALLVCGGGFDPRTLDVPNELNTAGWTDIEVLALKMSADGGHDGAMEAASANIEGLHTLFQNRLTVIEPVKATDSSAVGKLTTQTLVRDYGVLDYDVVLVDMSGLPSSLSFAIIQLFLEQAETTPKRGQRFDGDLLVVVSHDTTTDSNIEPLSLDNPSTLLKRLPTDVPTRIWVPVLGEHAEEQLKKLSAFLEPAETCPVLPFPSLAPRRGDELVVGYRSLLFSELEIDPRNVLYASESNPFDLYRQLLRLADRYNRALKPLGGAVIVASEHSSKLLSLGVLLASYDANIVIAHARPTAYRLRTTPVSERQVQVHTAWLAGQPFAS